MRKDIVESNPAILFMKVEQAILDGWRVVGNKTFVQLYPVYEVDLYKEDEEEQEIVLLTDYDALPSLTIEKYNLVEFLLELQRAILSGWKLDIQSLYFDAAGTKRIKTFKESHLANVKYTKEDLDSMDYESLKDVGKIRNCFNKKRDVMVVKILKFQEEGE